MLELIYSPYYDGNCYAGNPTKNTCELGKKYVGTIGLLNELELRAGLSRKDVSPMQRSIAYCNAIRKVLDGKPKVEPFYKQSFENDPLGVAHQLLQWRDALTMAGWSKDFKLPESLSADGQKRLTELQTVETYFDQKGMGDRWQDLLKADLKDVLPTDLSIVVDMKMDFLHPVVRKVLDKIGDVKESDSVKDLGDKTIADFAERFTLYKFPEQTDAYQWAVLQQEIEPDVFINEDNHTFNQVLKSVDKPLVGASAEGGEPEIAQLLKLGIALFRKPVNVTMLLNYLQVFRNPFDYYTSSSLKYHIQKVGGLGDRVDDDGNLISIADTIESALDSFKSNTIEQKKSKLTDPTPEQTAKITADAEEEKKKRQERYGILWGMWDKCIVEDNIPSVVAIADVKAFCQKLLEWIKQAKNNANAESNMSPMVGTQICSQFDILKEQIDNLKKILDGMNGNITNDELEKITATISNVTSCRTDYARLGSYDMLKDLKGLAIPVKNVVWLDCVGKPRTRDQYDFLNPCDRKLLNNENALDIPQPELEMKASDFAEKLAVSRADSIIALMPKHKDGCRTEENMVITELLATNKSIAITNGALPIGDSITRVEPDTQKVEHEVDKDLFANIDKPNPEQKKPKEDCPYKFEPKPVGYKRYYESYSSLSELINQPFDYVLDYLYNMKEEELDSNISTVEGTVAHAVISQMVDESKNEKGVVDTEKFLKLCEDKGLESRIDEAINSYGAIIHQPENVMECKIFKRILLNKSIPNLVKIIRENDLEVEDSEREYTTVLKRHDDDKEEKDAFNFNAKIDCILKKKNKITYTYEYYIFDFKWTGRPKKREEELNDRKELQLALYQKIMEANGLCPVVMRGYYLLKQSKLLTAYMNFTLNENIKIIEQKSTADIFNQAIESYDERIANLMDGYIEEGEEMKGTCFETTKFIGKYFNTCRTTEAVPNSYFLDNNLSMKYTKSSQMASMNATKKSPTYGKNIVLKGKIK